MKTREIDVLVHRDFELDMSRGRPSLFTDVTHEGDAMTLKAKLIIEIPEQKKEFTPSDIERAYGAIIQDKISDQYCDIKTRNELIEELFPGE